MIDTYLAMLTIQHRTIVFVEDLKYPYEDRISYKNTRFQQFPPQILTQEILFYF